MTLNDGTEDQNTVQKIIIEFNQVGYDRIIRLCALKNVNASVTVSRALDIYEYLLNAHKNGETIKVGEIRLVPLT